MSLFSTRQLVGVGLVILLAACGGAADESDDSSVVQSSAPSATTEPSEPELAPDPTTTDVARSPAGQSAFAVVRTDNISGTDIANMTVWAPDAQGDWPVVLLLAGWSGIGDHYSATAEALASHGVVVFAPDYRAQSIDGPDWRDAYRDAECAYRHLRASAARFGGDIEQPVTVIGHSTGAVVATGLALDEEGFASAGPFDRCPAGEVPRPDRVVALGGCYFASDFDGTEYPWDPSTFGWSHLDADIHMVVGADDSVCEAWQTEQAADLLSQDGFENVALTTLDDADHFDVVFMRWEGDGDWYDPATEWFDEPGDEAGLAAVQVMLDTVQQDSPVN